jgi:O-antigen ligase
LIFNPVNKIKIAEVIAFYSIIPVIIGLSLLLMNAIYLGKAITLLIVLIPAALLLTLNYRLTFGILVTSLFFPIVFEFYLSTYVALLVLASFLITHRKIKLNDFANRLNFPFVIFLISILGSYVFSQRIDKSLYYSFNLLAFFIIFYSISVFVTDYSRMKLYLYLFLTLTVLNGLIILAGGLTSNRTFGFAGVMFVDYAGLGLTQLVVIFLFTNIKKKLVLLPIILSLGLALILTQTRGVWVIAAVNIVILMIYVFFQSKKFFIKKSFLIIVSSLLILSFIIFGVYMYSVNKDLSTRTEKITDTSENIQRGIITSSLITRLFIWDTAINAFKDNRIVGTGFYTFPSISQNYNKIPKYLFDRFVKGLTPHETYLCMLAETGIIGFIGFLFLIYHTFRINYLNLKRSLTLDQKKYSLLLMFSVLYIVLSMIITDAWLWGHGMVLWSIILGFSAANYKIIFSQNAVVK